jgi:tRNA A37 threonylcarbamoyladenosine dehydratase
MSDLSREEELAARSAQTDLARHFAGVARLYGDAGAQRLAAAHVAVIGVGGVGSWAAEALARSGVGTITLVDLDHIAESNTNRQIHALGDNFGRAKVEAMAERIHAINPAARVNAIDAFVTAENVGTLLAGGFDAVLDCIDEVRAKAALVAACRDQRIALVTCGAAGGRLDPTRIRTDDLAHAEGDPLLAKLRHRLRRDYGYPAKSTDGRSAKFGVVAVFSDEPVRKPAAACMPTDAVATDTGLAQGVSAPQGLSCSGYGSSVTVTAPMGFVAAAVAMRAIARA